MGDNQNNINEKNTLIDFLYKDDDLINSFYSQLFGGNTESINKSSGNTNEIAADIAGSLAVVKSDLKSKNSDYKDISETIIPHDYKIIQLLDFLNLSKSTISNSTPGNITVLEGKLLFRDYDNLNKLIPFINSNNLVQQFNNPIQANAKGKNAKITIGKVLTQMFSLLPYGLEFELFTNESENAICILKEESLIISRNDIIRAYGSTLPSNWIVVGIIDYPVEKKLSSTHQFKSIIDEASSVFADMVLDNSLPTIRPIVIYRKIPVNQ